MAVDVFQLLSPQLGLALAGGNATLGSGSTLGGPGHFSVGVRANFFQGDLPDVSSFPTPSTTVACRTPAPARFPRARRSSASPTADAAIGLFGGVPLPLTNVGGIDLLLSATYIPNYRRARPPTCRIDAGPQLQLGYGVRVGLLKESIVVPGVSFTYLKRDLPTTIDRRQLGRTSPSPIRDAKVKTSAWRVVASKNLLTFGIAAGIGQDRYDDEANVHGHREDGDRSPDVRRRVALSQKLTRTNYFVDLSVELPGVQARRRGGAGDGGTVDTFNEFETGRADKSRTYGSVGFRIAF